MKKLPIYLDYNSTTPVDQRVIDEMVCYLRDDFGNEGSRTHSFGAEAKKAVQGARYGFAELIKGDPDDVIFTSGATESCNLAIQGLARWGLENNKKHIISSSIEHKAVLEPLEYLSKNGFEIDYIKTNTDGQINLEHFERLLRPSTLLVSVMSVNNETGIIQPIQEICDILQSSEAYFFCDASQSFGKTFTLTENQRIDLTAISSHKIFGPKGIGALIVRKRKYKKVPLTPIFFGGGQERGLRPGTLAVHQIIGFFLASKLAKKECSLRLKACLKIKQDILRNFSVLQPVFNGDQSKCMPNVSNISIPGINSEAAIVSLKDLIAVSNGSACTSASYKPSHVLEAMGFDKDRIYEAIRISWSHLTPELPYSDIINRLMALKKTKM
jgi:cysteine desulfurase